MNIVLEILCEREVIRSGICVYTIIGILPFLVNQGGKIINLFTIIAYLFQFSKYDHLSAPCSSSDKPFLKKYSFVKSTATTHAEYDSIAFNSKRT